MLGLKLIATNYPVIAAQMLNKIESDLIFFDEFIGDDLVQLYSLTKRHLHYTLRKKMLELILPYITKKAKHIIRYGLNSTLSRYKNYELGDTWDIQMTIEKMLSTGTFYPNYDNIVVRDPERKKKAIILCIDKSLSVMGLIHQIVLTAAVLTLALHESKIAVIAFDSKATVIKELNSSMDTEKLMKEILDLESSGKTNIAEALNQAYKELLKSSAKDKVVVLISDLERTVGEDPLPTIKRLPKLNVVFVKTSRKRPLINEIAILKNVSITELSEDSDLITLNKKILSNI